ncbi:MAG: tetratricopeptide repeat protein [Chloroflexota bacterium]
MDPNLLIVGVGLAYAVIFGAMALLRREGISTQLTIEALALTAVIAAGGTLISSPANPILFVVFLYLVTMRSRLLVDLANALSSRGRQRDAITILQVALRLYPDRATRLIVLIAMGVVQLRRQNPRSSQELLESVLTQAEGGGLGIQHQAACHYNLGLALQRQGKEAQAVRHFAAAVETFPGSRFARAAEEALERRRRGSGAQADKPPGASKD